MKQVLCLLWIVLGGWAAPAADSLLSYDMGGGLRLELIRVSRGTFTQGSPASDSKRSEDELQRQVTLTRDFYLGKFPVTRAQFEMFVNETRYRTEAERGASGGFGWDGVALTQNRRYSWRDPGFPQAPSHPVTLVTYDDALAFCNWLTQKTGRRCTLPTEAQWEYACRAGGTNYWHNSSDPALAGQVAWFRPYAANATHPVDSLKPNAWGFFITGNVAEWCRDWYGPYAPGPVADPEQTNPNASDKPRRVLRGGSWLRDVQHTRCAARARSTPGARNADNGFRVTAEVQPSDTSPAAGIELEAPAR
jgi:formylglycine-generating enzyme required for sulfatase activity